MYIWHVGNASENKLVQRSSYICPGYTLTYECSVIGNSFGATVWRGNAFNCTRHGGEISLLHTFYAEGSRACGQCNSGSIVA